MTNDVFQLHMATRKGSPRCVAAPDKPFRNSQLQTVLGALVLDRAMALNYAPLVTIENSLLGN